MTKKARILLLGLVLGCSACAAPSLRYKTEVNRLAAAGKFAEAEKHITSKQAKMYAKKDVHLAQLDRAALLHDAYQAPESDRLLDSAQNRIEDLYTKSISANAATLFINDLTTPYYVADYEKAFTFFYRAMNFLQQDNAMSAAVEARKAVFFLDHLRNQKSKGYVDDPFIQYFASLVFESVGQLSDARIARTNALAAYQKLDTNFHVKTPNFTVPSNAADLGEVIIFHYNGLLPLKTTQTLQLAWDRAMSIASSPVETRTQVAPEVQNALYAGIMGSAVTISFPALEMQPYHVRGSLAVVNGQQYPLIPVADLAALAVQDLKDSMPAIWFRTVTRAVVKQIAAVQARHAAAKAAEDDTIGYLAGMLVSALGAATEKADTRQWFTLPAQIYMTRLFVQPGKRDIQLLLKDKNGNIIGNKIFEDVTIPRGGRVYLHYRSAY